MTCRSARAQRRLTHALLAFGSLAACTTPDFRFPDETASGGSQGGETAGLAGAEAAGGGASGASSGASASGSGSADGGASGSLAGGGASPNAGDGGAPSDGGEGGEPADWHPAGKGLEFDGNSFVAFGAAPTDDLTIEMWISTTTKGDAPNFYNGAALFYADVPYSRNDFAATIVGDSFAFGTGSPDVTALSETAANTGRWVHVAGTRQRSNGIVRVLVNGRAESTLVSGNTKSLTDATLPWMGGYWNGTAVSHGFTGIIDEVRLWNVIRTAAQISANMNVTLAGDEPGLVGYWRFDDGSGLEAIDSSPSNAPAKLGGDAPAHAPRWVSYPPQK